MELMQLEMFLAVVEERSVQRAADRVFRTQPAVSMALRKLEHTIGTALLDRSRRGNYRLTQAGELLYEYASRMIGLRDEVLSTLRGTTTDCKGRLSIGLNAQASLRWLSRLTRTFGERNLNVRVEIACDGPEKLLRDLADRRIDMAFLSADPTTNRVNPHVFVIPVKGISKDKPLWLVRHRVGRSHVVRKFEETISALPQTFRQGVEHNGFKNRRLTFPSSLTEEISSLGNS